MSEKPPFIASQRMYLLDADAPDPKACLKPAVFRTQEEPSERTKEGDSFDGPWSPVSRRELFLDDSIRRLCITTDAGVGKTTSLEWAEQEIGRHGPESLALFLEMRQLPESRKHYLEPARDGSPPVLVETLRVRGHLNLDGNVCRRILQTVIEQGRLTLLVDAIDQTLVEENVGRKLAELQKFIHYDIPDCQIVIAGRPYAINRYWNYLFADGRWRHAQVGPFSKREQREYLGRERFAHLKRLDVEVLAVPRALETIRSLEISSLKELRTASDIYWRASETMLEQAFENREVRREGFTIDSARWLLSVLAFEMAREGNFSEVARDEMPEFRRRVWQRHKDQCDWESQSEFNGQLRLLGKLNEFMEYAVSNDTELHDIRWKNRSLQEFFAGLWMAYYAAQMDHEWIGQSVYVPDDKRTDQLQWMWRFAAEMPAEGRSPVRWVQSMAPLYQPGDGKVEGTRRSTEMLYRSWATMQACAASSAKPSELAARLLGDFQAEFQQILGGERGEDGRQIAEDFLREFRPIPPAVESRDSLCFRMGSPASEEGRLAREVLYETFVAGPFELACCPVTNQQYELFDPAHYAKRDKYSPEDQCPVLYVSFYDGWALCRWLGERYRMPTEKEWEYACRAGTTTPFHFGESLSSEQANFDGNSPYGSAPKAAYLGRTTPVGSYEPNAWGLHDMHGNVWEWCNTWVHEDPAKSDDPDYVGSALVLRGGSWNYYAARLRSAFRGESPPKYAGDIVGFRVARAPS